MPNTQCPTPNAQMFAQQKLLTVYAAAIAIAMVAWILNSPNLYWMAGAMFVLPTVSRLFGLVEHRGLSIERELPHAAHQGDAVSVCLRARNLLPLPKLQLSLADELPPGLTTRSEPVPVHLPPHGSDTAEYSLALRRRGVHRLEAVRVLSDDLLGLSRVESRVPAESSILVYPRVVELPGAMLPEGLGGGAVPLESSQRKGDGTSFFGIRAYRPGDPLRHVHWRTAARLGRLAVVEWEAEESTEAVLAIDTARGSERELDGGSSLDLAAGVAASLAAAMLKVGHSLRLLAPGTVEWRPAASRGSEALHSILEALARAQANSAFPLAAELRQVAPSLAPGTVVCWLTAVPDETLLAGVRYLLASRLHPIVYALIDLPAGRTGEWDPAAAELESLQVPVVRLHRDDDLTRRLLS